MTDRGGKRWTGRAMAILTLAVVLAFAGGGWWLLQPLRTTSAAAEAEVAATQPQTVEPGRDYYVYVKLIELNPKRPGGGKWEPRSASAPDIAFRLFWNGTEIFEGAERGNRLIGEWDLLRLDLKDALLSGQVEVASAINAPIIHVEAGSVLTIEVWDVDVARNDEAGKFDLPIDMLREGENTLKPKETGVARVVLEMVPRDTPLPDLLERASNR